MHIAGPWGCAGGLKEAASALRAFVIRCNFEGLDQAIASGPGDSVCAEDWRNLGRSFSRLPDNLEANNAGTEVAFSFVEPF